MHKSIPALLAAVSVFAQVAPAFAEDAPAAATAAATAPQAPLMSRDFPGSGLQLQYVDKSVKPGDDFDTYVNGKWKAGFVMPADKTRYGSFNALDDLSQDRLRGILDELVAKKADPATPEGKVAAAYTAYLDTAAIDAAGLAPAKPWLDRIAAAKTSDDLALLFAQPGIASPIGFGVDADEKDSDHYILYVSTGSLGLPDRDFYLVDNPRNTTVRAKYMEWLRFALGQAGYADPARTADAVYALETKLAGAFWDRALSRNPSLTYTKVARADAAKALPGLPVDAMLNEMGAGAAQAMVVTRMPPSAEALAAAKYTPEMAAKLGGGVPAVAALIRSEPVETWKAWLAAQFLASYAGTLPKPIDDARFAFYGTVLAGQQAQLPRWKRAIKAVEGQVGEQLGKIYADRYFPAENRAAMGDLVGNLRKAMAANLADLKWMGTDTRKEALAKLDAFNPKIGAPATFKDYAALSQAPGTPLANAIAAENWDFRYQTARIGKEVDRTEWGMLPETINAYYNPTFNEIVFPAAILQPPFFNLSADPAVNYGGIGAVIGHEMGHGFDDQGSSYDGKGNLREWWTDKDRAAFEALTTRLGQQYDAFCPFDEKSAGGKACVNGKLTMGENIGDVGGLSLAYRAYKLSLGGKPAPVIDGLTGDQRFFMSWAQVWRSQVRDETARQFLVTDPHSPPAYRINGVVRNFDEWYKAFGVKPSDKLYLPPAQRVRIW
ncbi:M13 family metallopeptidase [Novosphingobium sp. KCTC 2891]|uniref:M13 family metallopeptidase n=1 Tax=Novosphingobium sp. KCTC 2891 TaxID=2989730 RepID=UPI002222BC09|nr:M13 family metallopeptidase [Novosphingobium sp. KCTC 2891]MCW1382026.1 M13 family metallopeptidase [Novosphingobium sp. KCTC 2891]